MRKLITQIGFGLFLMLFLHNPLRACQNSSLVLDSVVQVGPNYNIYMTLCIGGGVGGATGRTTDFGLLFFGRPGMTPSFFTPSLRSDTLGTNFVGANPGPLPPAQFGILYNGFGQPWNCINFNPPCGRAHLDCNQILVVTNMLPDTIAAIGLEANGNPQGGCTGFPQTLIVFQNPCAPDILPPVLTCPPNLTQTANGACNFSLPNYTGMANATDNCDTSVTLSQSPAPGTLLNGAGTQQIVTITGTDDAGNTGNCSFTVTVIDTTRPFFNPCPPSFNAAVNLGCSFAVPPFSQFIPARDNCDPSPTVIQTPPAFTPFFGAGTVIPVTLRATDASGNVGTCNFNITLRDSMPPTVNCPPPVTLPADANCMGTVPNLLPGLLVGDNCDPNPAKTQNPAPGTAIPLGITPVVLTVTDASGNSANCTVNVTVRDVSPPVITCPGNQTANGDSLCNATLGNYTGLATATDNCTSPVITQNPAPGTAFNGSRTVDLIATDNAGNADTCTITVSVRDTIPPVFLVCPAPVTLPADSNCQGNIPNMVPGAMVSDNCDPNPAVSQSPAPGITVGPGITTVVFTVMDATGNSSTCSSSVNVIEATPPVVTCPANFTQTANGACNFSLPNYTGMANATDNCDTSVTLSQSPAPGTLLNGAGTQQIVTITGTDDAGNTGTCSFIVTVIDTTRPFFNPCPPSFNAAVNLGCSFAVPPFSQFIPARDNCDPSPSVIQTPPAFTPFFGAGTVIPVTLRATDASGNVGTCNFNITLRDSMPPTVNCPPPVTFPADANCMGTVPNLLPGLLVGDNCDPNPAKTQNPAPGTAIPLGITPVVLTVTDASGNSANCTVNVTVRDVSPPVITCPGNQTANADSLCNATLGIYTGLATATDNCSSPVITQNPAPGTAFNGSRTVDLIATDNAGNADTCTITVSVRDTIPPVFLVCPAPVTIPADSNCQGTIPNMAPGAIVSDNCDPNPSVSQSPAPGIGVGPGTTTVVLLVRDAAGNSSTCSSSVNVIEATPPVVTCPPNRTQTANGACNFSLPNYTGMANATDNCDTSVTLSQSPAPGTLLNGAGTQQIVTITGTDDAGNTGNCSFTVTVVDTTRPFFNPCPPSFNAAVNVGCSFAVPPFSQFIPARDNCDPSPSVIQTPPAFTPFFGAGTVIPVTLRATDASGNVGTCNFNITLRDSMPPTVNCPPPVTFPADANCMGTVPNLLPGLLVGDNCDPNPAKTQNPAPGTAIPLGITPVVLTVTDASGNSANCTVNVTVRDVSPPVITCPGNQTANADSLCNATLGIYTGLATATDNCTSPVITQNPAPGTAFNGSRTVDLIATDNAGNSDTCTITVSVRDTIPPVFLVCPAPVTILADSNCQGTIPNMAPGAIVSDNCDPNPSVSQSPAPGIGVGPGTTTVVLLVRDAAGNSSTCSSSVNVIEATPPVVTCPPNRTQTANGACNFSLPNYTGMANATDNCDTSVTLSQSPAPGTLLNGAGTQQIVTITGTDDAGNTGNCSFTVTVIDTTRPFFNPCPPSFNAAVNLGCSFAVPPFSQFIPARDNCDPSPTVIQTPPAFTPFFGAGTVIPVTLRATDASGNVGTCNFNITLRDSMPPTVNCPPPVTLPADANCMGTVPNLLPGLLVGDNCDPNPARTQNPAPGTAIPLGITPVILTVTDASGNSANCTVNVTVRDVSPPVITCPGNQTANGDSLCNATLGNYTGLATATDNCTSPVITQNPAPGTAFNGSRTVDLIATDNAGNADTCTITVSVRDITQPVILVCPGPVTLPADANCQAAIPNLVPGAIVSDNCDPNPAVSQSPLPATLAGQGITSVVLTVRDIGGNQNTCSVNVTVVDRMAPQIICPGNSNLPVNGLCNALIPNYAPLATLSDNCDLSVLVTQSPANGTPVSGAGIQTIVTLTGTDDDGNNSGCSFTVTTVDTISPVIVCPLPQILTVDVNCLANLPDYILSLPGVSDNCDPNVSLAQNPPAGTQVSGQLTPVLVTITAEDNYNNRASCSFSVDLLDVTPPALTCLPNQTAYADGNCEVILPDYSLQMPISDNCDPNPGLVQLPQQGSVITSQTLIFMTATDASNNWDTCRFYINVMDSASPLISCPPNQTISADSNCQGGLGNYSSMVNASDNCDTTVTLIQNPSPGLTLSVVGAGVTVSFTARDDDQNTNSCSFTVTLVDQTAPVFTCPTDLTLPADPNCRAIVPNFLTFPIVDFCDPSPSATQNPPAGNILPGPGIFPVILTAQDASGNSSFCTVNVTVVEITPPVPICPGNQSVFLDANCAAVLPNFQSLGTATDNCDPNPMIIAQAPAPGIPLFGHNTSVTVTLTARDISGNTDTCTFAATTRDTLYPTISCPGNQVVNNDPGQCGAIVNFSIPLSSDNCPAPRVILTAGFGSGSLFPAGTTQVQYSAFDSAGNASSCSFSVRVNDVEPPVFLPCPGDTTVVPDSTNCNPSVNFTQPVAGDNCSVGTAFGTHNPGDIFPIGQTQVTWTALDTSSNGITCQFTVTVAPATLGVTFSSVLFPGGTEISCPGSTDGSVVAGGRGGCLPYRYLWNTGDTVVSLTGLGAGTYIITVSDGNGGSFVDSITLREPAPAVLNFAVTNESCAGNEDGAINLSVTGGSPAYAYNWSNGDTIQDPDSLVPGNYQVTVTDANGCLWLGSATVQSNPLPVVSIGPDTLICEGDILLLNAGPGYASYIWSGGSLTQTQQVSVAGTYWVEVTDSNGCSARDSMVLTLLSNPVPVITQNGDTLFSSPAASYQWERNGTPIPSATNQSLLVSQTGTYSVNVTYANGCSNSSDTTFVVVGIGEEGIPGEVRLWPNPAAEFLNLEVLLNRAEKLSVEIRNTVGVQVFGYQSESRHESYAQKIDLHNLAGGVYFVTVRVGNAKWVGKVVKL